MSQIGAGRPEDLEDEEEFPRIALVRDVLVVPSPGHREKEQDWLANPPIEEAIDLPTVSSSKKRTRSSWARKPSSSRWGSGEVPATTASSERFQPATSWTSRSGTSVGTSFVQVHRSRRERTSFRPCQRLRSGVQVVGQPNEPDYRTRRPLPWDEPCPKRLLLQIRHF